MLIYNWWLILVSRQLVTPITSRASKGNAQMQLGSNSQLISQNYINLYYIILYYIPQCWLVYVSIILRKSNVACWKITDFVNDDLCSKKPPFRPGTCHIALLIFGLPSCLITLIHHKPFRITINQHESRKKNQYLPALFVISYIVTNIYLNYLGMLRFNGGSQKTVNLYFRSNDLELFMMIWGYLRSNVLDDLGIPSGNLT